MRSAPSRIGMAAWIALCCGWYIKAAIIDIFPGAEPSDFQWYYLAAHHILDRQSPYLAAGYIYPPLTAFLFTPFAAFEYLPARRAWFLLSHCFLLAAAYTLWRRMGAGWRSAGVVAFVWASGGAAEETLALGQIGPLLTLILAIASFAGPLQAFAISLGSALKIIPGALIVTLPLQRKWRTSLLAVALAALFIGVPWLTMRRWLPGPQASRTGFLFGTPTILSWSAPSIALRAMHPPGPDGNPPASWINDNLAATHLSSKDGIVSVAVSAVVMMGGLTCLAYFSRGKIAPPSVPFASAAMIALTLAAAPVCWTHYEILQYPGAAILLNSAIRGRRWWSSLGVLIGWLFLYTVPVTVLRAAYKIHGAWPNSPVYLYFWTSISAVASLGLFALALSELRKTQAPKTCEIRKS